MPWMWDTDNYMDNPDMYGYFYPEDLAAIVQIMYFESEASKKKK